MVWTRARWRPIEEFGNCVDGRLNHFWLVVEIHMPEVVKGQFRLSQFSTSTP
ncbi:MAG: hypothetical protein MRY77_03465 [Rhodobacteraceae bacterium]|nr:hypothetical protein [Paracoccaceae bacterium]